MHPELLNVEDSQRDTPLTIALKECSYFLVIYSTFNDGRLDDGTSYSDDLFFDHFPEVLGNSNPKVSQFNPKKSHFNLKLYPGEIFFFFNP
jgi:hypothetical protein